MAMHETLTRNNGDQKLLAAEANQEADASASSPRREPKDKEAIPAPPWAQIQLSSPSHPNDVHVHPATTMANVVTGKNDDIVNGSKEDYLENGLHREHQTQKHQTKSSESEALNGNNGIRRGQHPTQSYAQGNGHTNGDADRMRLRKTLDASLPNVTNRKLIKIRLNPGEKSAKPLMVTVAINASTTHGLGDMHDLSLGVGQKVQLKHSENDTGAKTLEISFQPSPLQNDSIPWEPPLVLTDEDGGRRVVDAIDQQVQPPPMPQDPVTAKSITATRDGAALKDNIASEILPPAMESPSRFAVNTATETSEIDVPIPTNPKAPVIQSLDPFIIPSILTPTIGKLSPTEKVGIAFRKAYDVVIIEKIVPGSPADGASLYPGYECLSINGHRLRSARRAAELVKESEKSLKLVVSNAPRPPGSLYTMISLRNRFESGKDFAFGMHLKIKHGLVKLVKIDANSPILVTSMKVGDFIVAINGSPIASVDKAVAALSKFNIGSMVPILYFSLRQLRVNLVEKVIGDLWKKEWSTEYKECVILQPGHHSLIPWTLRFKDDGYCTLLDPLRAFRRSSAGNSTSSVPPALHSVVETINLGVARVLSAMRSGVEQAASKSAEK